ncbi:hypothetical protein KAI87_10325 [Myxococcota bacterium]|nr:hypothetical protein [Myxococcota bacterium]
MEPIDIFAIKGIEYIFAVSYLLLLVPFWLMLRKLPSTETAKSIRIRATPSWFELPAELSYHQGHLWAKKGENGDYIIGLDDVAAKILGTPDSLVLPIAGDKLTTGDVGFKVQIEDEQVGLLAPISGEVLEINPKVVATPSLATEDNYGKGWLARIRPSTAPGANLLSGALAETWLNQVTHELQERLTLSPVGAVLQDGGEIMGGLAKIAEPDSWTKFAEDFLLNTSKK